MLDNDRWLLPEGIEEGLPLQAERLETLRRKLLDLFHSWGYELVMPPLIEYIESLLIGTGSDLDRKTFKLTDQLTGRMMGVRADMTPQVARIDAHRLRREAPTRLCYLGTVLHTRPEGLGGSRSPLQVGAELYGHAGIESDVEVIGLMLETLHATGIERLHLDLGHVGIYRGLVRAAQLDADAEARLFDALQRKAKPEIAVFLAECVPEPSLRDMLGALADLNGGEEVLAEARRRLDGAGEMVAASLDNLEQIAAGLARRRPDVALHFDLAELRGYNYHTGAVFAAFVPGQGQAVAVGGRYDDIGRVFGRARPATGFSTDLKSLMALSSDNAREVRGIFAPAAGDTALEARIDELRAAGERVIRALPGQSGGAQEMGCNRELVETKGTWELREV